jgi:hypothetical protein
MQHFDILALICDCFLRFTFKGTVLQNNVPFQHVVASTVRSSGL